MHTILTDTILLQDPTITISCIVDYSIENHQYICVGTTLGQLYLYKLRNLPELCLDLLHIETLSHGKSIMNLYYIDPLHIILILSSMFLFIREF